MLNAGNIVFLSLIIFTASIVRGFTGFGLALVAVPLIQFIIPVSDTAVFIAIINAIFSVIYFRRSRESVKGQPLGRMAIWTGVGVAAGTLILKFVNPAYIQLVWGVLIIFIVIALARGFSFGIRSDKSAMTLSGLFRRSARRCHRNHRTTRCNYTLINEDTTGEIQRGDLTLHTLCCLLCTHFLPGGRTCKN